VGCGYDVVAKYQRTPSVSYELSWVIDNPKEASSILVNSFKEENLEPVFQSNIGQVEKYYIQDDSSQINIIFYQDDKFKKLIVSIHPSRKVDESDELKEELKKREAAILRAKERIISSGNFHP
jgi:hypothetical protein